jgi:hypothetical protein
MKNAAYDDQITYENHVTHLSFITEARSVLGLQENSQPKGFI